jgi:hypothetical protein
MKGLKEEKEEEEPEPELRLPQRQIVVAMRGLP